MKNIIKIDVQENDIIETKLFEIDETIFDDFYLTYNTKKVKKNISVFNIKKREAKSYNDIGVQYSKNGKCVIVTFNVKSKKSSVFGQFLIGRNVNALDILNCNHPSTQGLHSVLMDACDLSKAVTLKDLLNLKRLF